VRYRHVFDNPKCLRNQAAGDLSAAIQYVDSLLKDGVTKRHVVALVGLARAGKSFTLSLILQLTCVSPLEYKSLVSDGYRLEALDSLERDDGPPSAAPTPSNSSSHLVHHSAQPNQAGACESVGSKAEVRDAAEDVDAAIEDVDADFKTPNEGPMQTPSVECMRPEDMTALANTAVSNFEGILGYAERTLLEELTSGSYSFLLPA